MHNVHLVQLLQSTNQLKHNWLSLALNQPSVARVLLNVLIQVPKVTVLKDQVDVFLSLDLVQQSDDVRVVQFL
jgi:hypothetical protein